MALLLLSANLGWIQGQFNFTEDSLRYLREKLRIQVQLPLHEPKTVEYHGFDDVAVGEVVVPCLGDGTVDDPSDAEGLKTPATIPRGPIEMLDPSMESAEVGTPMVFPESTRILQFEISTRGPS